MVSAVAHGEGKPSQNKVTFFIIPRPLELIFPHHSAQRTTTNSNELLAVAHKAAPYSNMYLKFEEKGHFFTI